MLSDRTRNFDKRFTLSSIIISKIESRDGGKKRDSYGGRKGGRYGWRGAYQKSEGEVG
jgi:hypothetical protein